MFRLFQMLSVFLCAMGIAVCFGKRKHRGVGAVLGLIGLLLVSSLISNAVVERIPLPTDSVVITATGEKNPEAVSNEVSIKGYLVGGKEYPLKTPSEGKWFWQGDEYKWRNENDFRQPKGTTRSILLDIPYGKDRSVQFYSNKWDGIVEVAYNGDSQKYDLFCGNGTKVVSVTVEDTESVALYTAKIVRLLIFVIIILTLMIYPCYVLNKYNNRSIRSFFSAHWSKFTYGTFAICCLAVMVHNNGRIPFWADEVWAVGWHYLGYPGLKSIYLMLNDLWFCLMPYGQEYLLLISELLSAVSIYIVGTAGELYKGKRFGVIMAALFASSTPVMIQGGSEFRSYAFLFFCTSGLLYFFLKKQKEQCKKKSTLFIYVVFLVLAMNTHPFGFVVAGLFMVFDFVLIILKKVKLAGLFEFIAPCIYAICWLCTLSTNTMNEYGKGWAAKPSFRSVFSTAKYLCNDNNLLLSIFLTGVAITAVYLIDRTVWVEPEFWKSYSMLTLLSIPIALTALTFLYSLVFRGASVFVSRYFTVLLPNIVFFITVAIDKMIEVFIERAGTSQKGAVACTLSCVLILCAFSWNGLPSVYANGKEDFRGSAEYLMSQNDIYKSSTICLVYGNKYHNAGFDYYLTQNGRRDPINHASAWGIKPGDLFEYETIYCVYHHYDGPDPAQFLENGYIEAESNTALALKKYVKSGEN